MSFLRAEVASYPSPSSTYLSFGSPEMLAEEEGPNGGGGEAGRSHSLSPQFFNKHLLSPAREKGLVPP